MGLTRQEVLEFFQNPPDKIGLKTYPKSTWGMDSSLSSEFFYAYVEEDSFRLIFPYSMKLELVQRMEDDVAYEDDCTGPRRTIWKVTLEKTADWNTKKVTQEADEFYLEFYGRNVSHEGTDYEGVRLVEPKTKTVLLWE